MKYAIFENRKNSGKCLAIYNTIEEANENLINPVFEKYPHRLILPCTELQKVGETVLH